MAVTSVIFDVGRVLYQWDLRRIYAPILEDAGELEWLMRHVITDEWHFQHDAGRSFDAMIAERTAEFPEHRAMIERFRSHWLGSIPGPVPGSLEIVRELHGAGIPLFAITNFGAEAWAMFRPTASIFDLFGDVVVSGVERRVKPDPAIFELAIRRFGIKSNEALFTDDNAANIASAAALGFATHHFVSAESLRSDMEALALL